ncbi:iron efflux ABC transporter ATP-binding subunit FetA [Pantoea phytobeneficialis]|uniref:Iron ABC transporter ATP-binding protein FetA n=1 Tax=Pantoea phytobeneficialis TaxID=2052056 RepID=A0AAP9KRN7_9GAMM|nr:iron ABC transporter ATP-binding protein FetA [Pantoea phytobeneficialis]MDO6406725.1 iron ABC transporter ATP-binding protein FetA [Pantoea phytobeneficialis]QGR09254.1 iron ABC transporter ATP-binding protein FetA [Pantoea phytobeneficialis]
MANDFPLLDVQGVTFSQEGRELLAPVSLQLNPGDFLLLTGPSGSGKSTLLKIIASLLAPSSGQIRLQNQDITQLKAETYRQQVSYCFQTPVLFGSTVYDNLALPWQIRQQKPNRDAFINDLAKVNLPADTLDKKIDQLSGGEKQRVGLLRNLQFLPQVLLLDEVTSALDEDNKALIHRLISEMVTDKGVAVIWISHDVEEIHQASRVLKLHAPERNDHESA